MEIAELKKLINTELVKYKAYKEAEKALDELDALKQSEQDLKKSIDALKKELTKLEYDKKDASDAIAISKATADEIVDKAGKAAVKIVNDANDKADAIVKKAVEKEAALSNGITAKEMHVQSLTAATVSAESKLADINSALDKAKDKLKGLLG
jgi:cell division septum initiation protein DivIVA